MPIPESIKPYLPFILVLVIILALYMFSLLGGQYIKPKRTVLNESIGALAYPRLGILKEQFNESLKVENETLSSSIANYDKVEIFNGWLRANFKVFSVYLEKNVSYVKINFEVKSSNRYGDLFILVNGDRVWSKTPKGKVSVLINRSYLKSGQNEITLGTDTSWRFWAPTFYNLRSLSMQSITVEKSIPKINFKVPRARGLYAYGILSFFVEERGNNNPLTIKLNDRLVSSVVEEKKHTIDVSDELVKGNNSLVLSTHSNSFDLSNVLLRIKYSVSNSSYQTDFTVSDREYEYLTSRISKATLSFDIIPFTKKNVINMTINGDTVLKKAERGHIDISDEIEKGKNTLELTAIGGVFHPKSLVLLLE